MNILNRVKESVIKAHTKTKLYLTTSELNSLLNRNAQLKWKFEFMPLNESQVRKIKPKIDLLINKNLENLKKDSRISENHKHIIKDIFFSLTRVSLDSEPRLISIIGFSKMTLGDLSAITQTLTNFVSELEELKIIDVRLSFSWDIQDRLTQEDLEFLDKNWRGDVKEVYLAFLKQESN